MRTKLRQNFCIFTTLLCGELLAGLAGPRPLQLKWFSIICLSLKPQNWPGLKTTSSCLLVSLFSVSVILSSVSFTVGSLGRKYPGPARDWKLSWCDQSEGDSPYLYQHELVEVSLLLGLLPRPLPLLVGDLCPPDSVLVVAGKTNKISL